MIRVYSFWRNVTQAVFPPTCTLCGDPGYHDLDLCRACDAALPRIRRACPTCGLPLAPAARPSLCGRCLRHPPRYHARLVAPYRYADPLAPLIQRMKFSQDLGLANLLGGLLARRVARAPRPDWLVPVPLHRARLRERGYNQSLEIARMVGRRLDLPLWPKAAQRIRATQPQTTLERRERRTNVRGAFAAAPAVAGARLALIDDVVSTGHTIEALTRVLCEAGAAEIQVWAVARAIRGD